jgi:hypothetical protein
VCASVYCDRIMILIWRLEPFHDTYLSRPEGRNFCGAVLLTALDRVRYGRDDRCTYKIVSSQTLAITLFQLLASAE